MTTTFALTFDWSIVAKDLEADLRSAADLVQSGRVFDAYRLLSHCEENAPAPNGDRAVVHADAKTRVGSLLVAAGAARMLCGSNQERQALSVLTRVLNGEPLTQLQRPAGGTAHAPANGSRPSGKDGPRRLARSVVARMRTEIAEANGREVLFVASDQDDDGVFRTVRVAARGTTGEVFAATRGIRGGELCIHNHPAGNPVRPSEADLRVAEKLHQSGIGMAIVDVAVAELYVVTEPITPRPHKGA